jgi:hypothetical protein
VTVHIIGAWRSLTNDMDTMDNGYDG